MQIEKHIDGYWWTSRYNYKGYKLMIKMRENHGSKIHIFALGTDKVIKTFAFIYATDIILLDKAHKYIDNKLLKKTDEKDK
jgi:hypothetical protein